MVVELKPETERLVQEEIESGHFDTVDQLIQESVCAWRVQHHGIESAPRKPLKNLADFLLESPFAGSDLDLEREKDYGRPVDL